MDKIEYGRVDWNKSAEAANAEAQRRATWTRDQPDPEARKAVWLCDLGALTSLPQELAEIEGLKQLFVGDGQTPDGLRHYHSKEIMDWSVLAKLTALSELSADDSGLDDLGLLSGLTGLISLSFGHTQVRDLGPLSGLSMLSSLSFVGTQVRDLGPLSGLSVLSSLRFDRTKVSDLGPLSGLSELSSLSFGDTEVSDLGPLSGLSMLSSLRFDRTKVSDLGPLSGLSELSSLSFGDTEVSDLGPLSGLSGLSVLNFNGTKFSDLHILLSLPAFASMAGRHLSFKATPLAQSDRRWQMLSGLPPKIAATDVILYLKGEHPDFREPLDGVQHSTGQAAMASGGPVTLVEQDGLAEVADVQQFQPPIAMDAPLVAQSLGTLRALVTLLTDDLKTANNVDPLLRSRVARYADALQTEGTPTLTVLDANMLLIRGMVADDYVCAALDKGTLDGLTRVIQCHDQLGATPIVPEVLPTLPDVPDQPVEMRAAIEAIKGVEAAVRAGVDQGLVGNTVVVAINSTVDVANTAFSTVPAQSADEATQRRGLGSWALRMAGGLAWSLDVYARAHSWSLTPAGAALMQSVAELIKKLLPFFGG
ncbi:MAG: hypothetical protein ABJR46_04090 [Tateyamaria sp.]|uniref:hypothetical protein n=1 Tax=Tateyamaria sp. TaxID=1929288 RepID=UPI0032A100BF